MNNSPLISRKNNDLPVFVKWLEFLEWLLPVTEKFPKRVRFTFADRINNLCLDVAENLVEARYTKNKAQILQTTNLQLEKLRVLLRLSQRMYYLSYQRYEFSAKAINEVGRMLGGWKRQQNP